MTVAGTKALHGTLRGQIVLFRGREVWVVDSFTADDGRDLILETREGAVVTIARPRPRKHRA